MDSIVNSAGLNRMRLLAIFCSIACGSMTATAWLPSGVELEFTPDSSEYVAIATNLQNGRGYTSTGNRIAANRSPAYPVVLSILFDERADVWHSRIVWFHRCLSFVIGASIVWIASELFGLTGTVCGVLASVLAIVDDTLVYGGKQVLTELPATSLLMVSVLAAHWAVRGSGRREFLMAAIHIGLFMTRSAMIFCGVGYGIYLIYQAVTGKSQDGVRRILWFGVPCTIAVLAWSIFLWVKTGQVVLLTTTGMSNMAAGLSPEYVAATQGWPIPRNDRELEDFWTMAPGISADDAMATIPLAIAHPVQTLRLTVAKFRIAFSRMPLGAFFLAICGIAVQFCAHLRERSSDISSSRDHRTIRQMIGQGAYFVAFCVCMLAVCGFSHTLTKAAVAAAVVMIIICRVSPAGRPYVARVSGDSVPPILFMVCFGFVLMTLISFGLPRFIRPFLPPLYLSATLCVPLAFRLINTVSDRCDSMLLTDSSAIAGEFMPTGTAKC